MRKRILLATPLCVVAVSLVAIPNAAIVDTVPVDRVITNLEPSERAWIGQRPAVLRL